MRPAHIWLASSNPTDRGGVPRVIFLDGGVSWGQGFKPLILLRDYVSDFF